MVEQVTLGVEDLHELDEAALRSICFQLWRRVAELSKQVERKETTIESLARELRLARERAAQHGRGWGEQDG